MAVTGVITGRNNAIHHVFRNYRMLDSAQQQVLVTRLNRVEGQVRGIKRMVQEPRLCLEILQQLSAAEAALNRVSLAILRFHVEECVPKGVEQSPEEGRVRLKELIDIFDRFAT
jgi:DNA-binding FrmR family transcriptional regulator